MRTEKELQDIAIGLAKGEIFSDWQINNDEDVSLVFQAINFMTKDQLGGLKKENIGMLYEYKSEAAYHHGDIPIFVSFHCLSKEEALKVGDMFTRYHAILHDQKEIEI